RRKGDPLAVGGISSDAPRVLRLQLDRNVYKFRAAIVEYEKIDFAICIDTLANLITQVEQLIANITNLIAPDVDDHIIHFDTRSVRRQIAIDLGNEHSCVKIL